MSVAVGAAATSSCVGGAGGSSRPSIRSQKPIYCPQRSIESAGRDAARVS